MAEIKSIMEEIEVIVYYDTQAAKFRTIRGIASMGYILSAACEFYRDAKTTPVEETVPEDYFQENLMKVEDIEKFPFKEKIELAPDYFGYRAIEITGLEYLNMEQLRYNLEIAVKNENYEDAAQIRDEIGKR